MAKFARGGQLFAAGVSVSHSVFTRVICLYVVLIQPAIGDQFGCDFVNVATFQLFLPDTLAALGSKYIARFRRGQAFIHSLYVATISASQELRKFFGPQRHF